MAGTNLTNEQKNEIYNRVVHDGATKAEVGRTYHISPRTVGRVVDEIMSSVDDFDDPEEIDDLLDIDFDPVEEVGFSFVLSGDQLVIIRSEGGTTDSVTVYEGSSEYAGAVEALTQHSFSDHGVNVAYNIIMSSTKKHQAILSDVGLDWNEDGLLEIVDKGVVLPTHISDRITYSLNTAVLDEGKSLKSLVNFTIRLMENPSYRCVNELYDFLKASNIQISDEGKVVAYKKVREDYRDCFSGRIDNTPGQTPKVDRNTVDEDSNRTCSRGLHVCSKSYLSHYPGSRVLEVEIDPKDFVAIPEDYYDGDKAKARVCEYHVVRDITEDIREEGIRLW